MNMKLLKIAIKSLSKETQNDRRAWYEIMLQMYFDKSVGEDYFIFINAENIPVLSEVAHQILTEISQRERSTYVPKKAF